MTAVGKKKRDRPNDAAWIAGCAAPPAIYALLLASAKALPLPMLPAAVAWAAFGTPLALFIFVAIKGGSRMHDGLWGLASITLLVGAIGAVLFLLAANQVFVPAIVKGGASPAGLIVALLWTGWLSFRAKRSDSKASGKIGRAALAILGAASIAALIVIGGVSDQQTLYGLILYGAAITMMVGNALFPRGASFRLMLPFVMLALSYLAPLLSGTVIGPWLPAATSHAFTISAYILMTASLLSFREARS